MAKKPVRKAQGRSGDPTCFVITPTLRKLRPVYRSLILPAISAAKMTPLPSEKVLERGTESDLLQALGSREVRIVIADITARDPDTFYRIGAAHALGKRGLFVSAGEARMPAVLAQSGVLRYSTTSRKLEAFKTTLKQVLGSVVQVSRLGKGRTEAQIDSRLSAADSFRDAGDARKAIPAYEEALALQRWTASPRKIADTLSRLGQARLSAGAIDQAAEDFQAVLELLPDGDRIARANAYARLAAAMERLARVEDARGYYMEAIKLLAKAREPDRLASALNNLGVLLAKDGQDAEAKRYLRQAAQQFRKSGNRGAEARSNVSLAEILVRQGQVAKVGDLLDKAEKVMTEANDQAGLASLWHVKATLLLSQGGHANVWNAIRTISKSIQARKELGVPEARAASLVVRAQAKAAYGRPDTAIRDLATARRIQALAKDRVGLLRTLRLTEDLFRRLKQRKEANEVQRLADRLGRSLHRSAKRVLRGARS